VALRVLLAQTEYKGPDLRLLTTTGRDQAIRPENERPLDFPKAPRPGRELTLSSLTTGRDLRLLTFPLGFEVPGQAQVRQDASA
jgi:hypothetical protein